jgi:hypothetical protein
VVLPHSDLEFAASIDFHRSPLTALSLTLASEGPRRFPCSQSVSEGWGVPYEGSHLRLGWFCLKRIKFHHRPCFSWSTRGRQDSSRGLPFAEVSLYRKRASSASPRFLVYEPGGESWEGLRRSSLGPSGGCSFFKAFRRSLSFKFH